MSFPTAPLRSRVRELRHRVDFPTIFLTGVRPLEPFYPWKLVLDEHGNPPFHALPIAPFPREGRPAACDASWPSTPGPFAHGLSACPTCKGLIGKRRVLIQPEPPDKDTPAPPPYEEVIDQRETTVCLRCGSMGRVNDEAAANQVAYEAERKAKREAAVAREAQADEDAAAMVRDLDRLAGVKRTIKTTEVPTLDYETRPYGRHEYQVVAKRGKRVEVTETVESVERELTEAERRWIARGCRGDGMSSRRDVRNRAKVGDAWLAEIGQSPDYDLILGKNGQILGRYSELVAAEPLVDDVALEPEPEHDACDSFA
jgi:hypothetical protein